jgi:hypothetical protein
VRKFDVCRAATIACAFSPRSDCDNSIKFGWLEIQLVIRDWKSEFGGALAPGAQHRAGEQSEAVARATTKNQARRLA